MTYYDWLTSDRPDLSSERAPHMDRTATFRQMNKYLIMSPRRGSKPRQTYWLTVSRKVTLTFDSDQRSVRARKILRQDNSSKLFRDFPRSQNKCPVDSQFPYCTACFTYSFPNVNTQKLS
jgi:hypothetical protein